MSYRRIAAWHGTCFDIVRLNENSWLTNSLPDAVEWAKAKCTELGLSHTRVRVYPVFFISKDVVETVRPSKKVTHTLVKNAAIVGKCDYTLLKRYRFIDLPFERI